MRWTRVAALFATTGAKAMSSQCATKKAGIVFLHGLGDSPAGWSDLQYQLGSLKPSLKSSDISWVFPGAPTIPIAINGGARMPGWFDIYDWPIDTDAKDDRKQVLEGVETVRAAIKKLEASGVPAERIVVGGFSQGGAIALNTAYRHESTLAAAVALSGWIPLKEDFGKDAPLPSAAAAKTPCFWGHGTIDDKVLFPHQAVGVAVLKAKGVTVADSQYSMGHGAHPDEMAALAAFLDGILFP